MKCKNNIEVWQRGVDTDVFNPKFRSMEMRSRMSNGNPDDTLLVYVGRLGAGEQRPCHNLLYQVHH
jgi:sulfoquinovosyltransferase